MNKRLIAFIFAISMLAILNACPAYAQNSQTIGGNVPFAFTANDRTLVAGHYRIEPVGDNRTVWRIRGGPGNLGLFVLALTREGRADGDLRLTFHRYGDRYFLAGFKTPSYEIALPVSRGEKILRLAKASPARIEVIAINAGISH